MSVVGLVNTHGTEHPGAIEWQSRPTPSVVVRSAEHATLPTSSHVSQSGTHMSPDTVGRQLPTPQNSSTHGPNSAPGRCEQVPGPVGSPGQTHERLPSASLAQTSGSAHWSSLLQGSAHPCPAKHVNRPADRASMQASCSKLPHEAHVG